MNLHASVIRPRPRCAQQRLVQAGVVACGLMAGLVELLALQRRRLAGLGRALVHGPRR